MPPKKKTKSAKEDDKEKKKVRVEKEEEEDDDDEETEDEETDDEDRGRGKRKRRESKSFEPEDFTMASERAAAKAAVIVKGRGKKLGDLPVVKAAIEKTPLSSEDLPFAYTFVFSTRGVPTKKEMKNKLLEFSGYLPPLPKGKYDEDEQDAEDEKFETKYATKAFKLNLAQVRRLCDFFHVDRETEDGKALNKEQTIDRLLDFLGDPNDSYIKTDDPAEIKPASKKKKAPKTKTKAAAKRKSVSKKVVEDPFSVIKAHSKGSTPTDAALRQWVKAYVVCFDMDSATTKHAIKTASDKFGVDLADRKATIKEFLAEEM
mmetsp:Transcript_21559/g.40258  ORF Transcript_21559/g.40258 Transcript_21559/m.40258 type:complete len:317 (-) Transcript_21559:199-1149(-)